MRGLRWQPPRGLVVLVMFVLAALIAVVLGFLVLRAIVREVEALMQSLPAYADAIKAWLDSVVAAYPGVPDVDLNTWVAANLHVVLGGLSGALTGVLSVVGFDSGGCRRRDTPGSM
jgi:predicted PurR-regulated permease PerM